MNELDKTAFMVYYSEEVFLECAMHLRHDKPLKDFPEIFEEALIDWNTYHVPARTEEHCGDCTNVPAPCMRCQVDDYYEKAEKYLEKMNE